MKIRTDRPRRLAKALFGALALTFCLFAVYEILERRWLTAVDMQTLHMLHLLRGILGSVLAAGFVAWMIMKRAPDLLPAAPAGEYGPEPLVWTDPERTKTYALWFIAMRWIAALLAAILVFISVQVLGWLPKTVWWPLMGTVAVLVGANLLYTLCVRWNRGLPGLLLWQGYLDLLALTTLLHFSGGIENPLSMMMIFHVIIGGILLSSRQCYGIAATASGLFAILTWLEWAGIGGHYTLQLYPHQHSESHGGLIHPAQDAVYGASFAFLQTVVMFLTAYFVTTLARRLRENEQRLEALAASARAGQQLLEQALETTGTGLRVVDRSLDPFWANRRWMEWFESTPPQSRLRRGSEPGAADSPARATLADGRVRVTEIVSANATGAFAGENVRRDERVLQITTAPLRDESGNTQRIVELAQDITQQKRAQVQMMRAGRLAAVGELAGHVAHEVNNPIAILSAKVHLLLTDHPHEMSPKVAQELGKIADLASRVARIAQGLLSFCRPSSATRVRLDVRLPIRKSLAMVEQHARKIGVVVQDRLPLALPPVEANAQELEQVFLNLFLNAFDAMPKGGRLRVEATVPDERPVVVVTVEDSGPGIPAAIRDRIFEPFFTTKEEGRGTGLGLSICLGLVRSHGGRIEVESPPGRGARFTVELPVAAPPAQEHSHG